MFRLLEKNHKLFLLGIFIGLIAGLIPSFYFNSQSKRIQQEKAFLEKERQELLRERENKKINETKIEERIIGFEDKDEAFYCEDKKPTLKEIMRALPEEAKYYRIYFRGMSPECSYYALGIYYGGVKMPGEDWPEIDSNCITNEVVGAWVVKTRTGEAERIATCRNNEGKYHENNFSRWVTDQLIELLTDDKDYARIIDVVSGETVFRRVNRVNLYLPDIMPDFRELSDVQFILLDDSFVECQKEGYLSWPFIQYDFDCLRKTDVEVQVKGGTKLLMSYIDDQTIEVNGVVYKDLLDYQNREIHISY